jgi:hypothetical protein
MAKGGACNAVCNRLPPLSQPFGPAGPQTARLHPAQMPTLRAISKAGGVVAVATLVKTRIATGEQPGGVARACLSRALRRLWRGGFVELHTRKPGSPSSRSLTAATEIARDPARAYSEHRAFLASLAAVLDRPVPDRYGSPEAFAARRRVRMFRATWVALTDAGRESANSSPPREAL